jgi:hypothetical protein
MNVINWNSRFSRLASGFGRSARSQPARRGVSGSEGLLGRPVAGSRAAAATIVAPIACGSTVAGLLTLPRIRPSIKPTNPTVAEWRILVGTWRRTMQNLFDRGDRDALVGRLSALQPSNSRQWGKMNVSQMLAHSSVALEVPCGDRVKKQSLLGRVVAPFVRTKVLGLEPFPRSAPSDPDYRITDERDFQKERVRLAALVDRFCSRGPAGADGVVHPFFGRMSGDEWGRLMYKHLDHHLRQFGA